MITLKYQDKELNMDEIKYQKIYWTAYPWFKNILNELEENKDPELKRGSEYFQRLHHYFWHKINYCEKDCDTCEGQKSLNELNWGAYLLFVTWMYKNKKIDEEDFLKLIDLSHQHGCWEKLKD